MTTTDTPRTGHQYGRYDRCGVSSWKGEGDSPPDNKCKLPLDHPGTHLDRHGNRFDATGVVTVRNNNRPGR